MVLLVLCLGEPHTRGRESFIDPDLDQDRSHNKVNEITDITETIGTAWVTPVEDRNGNMTTVPKPSSLASGLTLTFDAWNRLSEVKDGATVVARYEYDGQNRRVKKHLDSQSPAAPDGVDTYIHYFYNSSWQILETRETTTESDQPENLQPKYQHVWSPRYIDAPILRDENTDQDSLCDDHRLYYLGDANFNVTTLIDTAGDPIERYLYNPYGKVTIYDGTWSSTRSTSSYNNAILYTARERDPETGLYCYRIRYYYVDLGRFVSRDPIGYEAADANVYRYCANSPAMYVDPNGMDRYITRWGSSVSAVHCGVAVDTWKCENGKWVKTGIMTFDFSMTSWWGVIPGVVIWWGTVVSSGGLNLTNPVTFSSTPCEDQKMLKWLNGQVRNPPFFSGLFHNCMFWSVGAVNMGMGTKCECCGKGQQK